MVPDIASPSCVLCSGRIFCACCFCMRRSRRFEAHVVGEGTSRSWPEQCRVLLQKFHLRCPLPFRGVRSGPLGATQTVRARRLLGLLFVAALPRAGVGDAEEDEEETAPGEQSEAAHILQTFPWVSALIAARDDACHRSACRGNRVGRSCRT